MAQSSQSPRQNQAPEMFPVSQARTNLGMSVDVLPARPAERDHVQHRHVVPDHRRLTHHDTRAVVNEHPLLYSRYTSSSSVHFRCRQHASVSYKPWVKGPAYLPYSRCRVDVDLEELVHLLTSQGDIETSVNVHANMQRAHATGIQAQVGGVRWKHGVPASPAVVCVVVDTSLPAWKVNHGMGKWPLPGSAGRRRVCPARSSTASAPRGASAAPGSLSHISHIFITSASSKQSSCHRPRVCPPLLSLLLERACAYP
jgi:hypothetical protein